MNEDIINLLKVLSDNTRLEILFQLSKGEKTNSDLQKALNKRQSTISHQLSILTNANLVEFELRSKLKYYSVKNTDIFKCISMIEALANRLSGKELTKEELSQEFRDSSKKDLMDSFM